MDVTERERAQRESDRFFTLALDLLCVAGFDGYFKRINPAWERLLGYTEEELLAKPWVEFIHPDDIAPSEVERVRLREGGTLLSFENRYRHKDGSYRWILWSCVSVTEEQSMYAVGRDVSARKLAEEERNLLARRLEERTADLSRANTELSKASRLKDEFLASMSHELRTPLNAVLGLSEALQEGVYGSLNDRQKKSLRSVEGSGRHLLSLINDILDLSRIGAGRLDLEVASVDVRSVCAASVGLIQQAAQNKRITVSCVVDGSVKTIQADERRLKQILLNLLSNAVKFTPENGSVGLEVHADAEPGRVRFTVWDTGIGIAEEDLPRLFRPFVQLDSRLARQFSGTGLGLSLVYRMTELHGGCVGVESEPGKGSRFSVLLPWQEKPTTALNFESEGADGDEPRSTSLKTALVIEDSPAAQEQITRYLGELGVTSIVHPDADGALEKVHELCPDLVVLDLLFGAGEALGWNVLTALKSDVRTEHIPVLVTSVLDDRAKAFSLGAAEYLVKPIARTQIQQALRTIQHPAGQPRSTPPSSPFRDRRQTPLILLAEDNESNIATVTDYLTAKGYRVSVARDGGEAAARATEERPDLVLMDIQMPVVDGLEAIRRIRADTRLATIPIIALTALAMPGDRDRCIEVGANEYRSKPVNLKELVRAIEAHLGGPPSSPPPVPCA